jgi:hypothetical protein
MSGTDTLEMGAEISLNASGSIETFSLRGNITRCNPIPNSKVSEKGISALVILMNLHDTLDLVLLLRNLFVLSFAA